MWDNTEWTMAGTQGNPCRITLIIKLGLDLQFHRGPGSHVPHNGTSQFGSLPLISLWSTSLCSLRSHMRERNTTVFYKEFLTLLEREGWTMSRASRSCQGRPQLSDLFPTFVKEGFYLEHLLIHIQSRAFLSYLAWRSAQIYVSSACCDLSFTNNMHGQQRYARPSWILFDFRYQN